MSLFVVDFLYIFVIMKKSFIGEKNEVDEVIQTLLKIPQEVEDYCYKFFLNGFSWQSVKVFIVDKYERIMVSLLNF